MNVEQTRSLYASPGRRILAMLIDCAVLSVPCTVASYLIPLLGGLAVWFFYAPVLESSELRATLGKRLLGIQVTDVAGGRISLKAALIRNALKFISSALVFIGFFLALFTEKKQALHDLLADTLVVNGRSARPIVDTWMETVRSLYRQLTEK